MALTRTIVQNQKARQSFLRVRGLTICRVQWFPTYEPSYTASKIFSEPEHVLYLPTVENYKNRVREGLWWHVTSNTMTGMRCMRSHGNRRLRISMIEALLAKGYDKEGRLLGSSGAGRVGVELRGSVQIHLLKPCMDVEWVEVQKQAGLVLDKIMELCQGYKR